MIRDSYSLGKKPSSIESAVLQDADKLDALGAIGTMRAISCGYRLGSSYYNSEDPFAERRDLDDKSFTIDHFHTKLFKLPALMNTKAARSEAERRVGFMRRFLSQLREEVSPTPPSATSYSFHSFTWLEGSRLKLRPLTREDLQPLAKALISSSTWFSTTRDLDSQEKFVSYFEPMLERQARGESLTVIVQNKDSNEMLAMSTYQFPSVGFRKVEIGFTWIADQWQRTFVNTEMKLIMLKHAFEGMKTNRVEFSVHPKNEKSNLAMKRIGARLEGTLRKWRFLPGQIPDDGDRNLYSILDDEWPEVRQALERRLSQ